MSGGRAYGGGRGGRRGRGGRGRGGGRPPKPTWAQWQLDLKLPDVDPGSDFGSLEFACWNCGTTLIKAGEIQRFGDPQAAGKTTNAVWTVGVPDTLVGDREWVWNDVKECNVKTTYCKKCLGSKTPGDQYTFSIGSTYDAKFSNEELGISGPCCKMVHTRVNKKGKAFRSMVVLGTEANYQAEISKIQSADPAGSAVGAVEQEEQAIRESLRDLGVEEETINAKIIEVKNEPLKFAEDQMCSDLAIALLSMGL
eukprot:gene6351-24939_t